MTEKLAPKDPDEILDYVFTWGDELGADEIVESTWSIVGDAGTLVIERSTETASTTTAWLSGGTQGEVYDILNRISTYGGRTFDRTARLLVKAK